MSNVIEELMNKEIQEQLGPLAALAGVWEGDKGDDTAPADDRLMTETNKFRERMTFEPIKPAQNHEQTLYGLRSHGESARQNRFMRI